ncbi:MAG: hypothetical protein KDA52_19685 [Planctomycetaceae bacterium]|nr:hypothetical protein [Planctomycetaceae bacterium]
MSQQRQWMYRSGHDPTSNSNTVVHGPVTTDELKRLARTGRLKKDAYVRPVNAPLKWRAAGSMQSLFPDHSEEIDIVLVDETPAVPQSTPIKKQSKSTETLSDIVYLGFVVILLLVCCFPVGLYLVATHPSWNWGTKSLVALGWLSLMGIGFYADREENRVVQQAPSETNPKPSGTANEADNYRTKLDTWKQEGRSLRDAMAKLEEGRQQLVKSMSDVGSDSPRARVYAEEILEIDAQAKLLSRKIETYDTAIVKAESTLRRVERRKLLEDVGVTTDELNELAETVYELDESLRKMSGDQTTLELDVEDVLQEVYGE